MALSTATLKGKKATTAGETDQEREAAAIEAMRQDILRQISDLEAMKARVGEAAKAQFNILEAHTATKSDADARKLMDELRDVVFEQQTLPMKIARANEKLLTDLAEYHAKVDAYATSQYEPWGERIKEVDQQQALLNSLRREFTDRGAVWYRTAIDAGLKRSRYQKAIDEGTDALAVWAGANLISVKDLQP